MKTTRKTLMTLGILTLPTLSLAQTTTPQVEPFLNVSPEIQTFMEKINLFTDMPVGGEPISRADATTLFMNYLSTTNKNNGVKNLEDTTKCTFTDTASLNATLQQSIKDACEYGLFKGNRGKFSPTESLTRAQTLAVLSRIAGANIIEGNPRRKGYYDFAVQKKRYLPQTGESMEWNITKENFVKLLYSFDTLTSPTSPHPEGTTSGTQTSLIPLTNTSRILEEVDGTPVSGEYTLTFSGSAMNTKFCNGIGGTYSISGNTIQGSFVSTQMLCLDKEKNNFEQLFQLSGANFSIITTTGEKAGSEHLILTTSDKHTFKYLKKNPTIGGQTDEHGCYLGAGYRRNEKAQECQRPWEQTTTGTISSLDNTQWELESFNGKPLTGKYVLSFQQGQLSTKFCNQIQGSYTLSGDKIYGTLISTRMICLTEEPSLLENGFNIEGGKLTLTDDTLTLTTNENVYVRKSTLSAK